MKWIWQLEGWPNFTFDQDKIKHLELEYYKKLGIYSGATLHLSESDHKNLVVDILSDEASSTSEIEGEILSRSSIQSSIKREFGLITDNRKVSPAENGIAEVMIDLYKSYDQPLTHRELFKWHSMVVSNRRDLKEIGAYRSHVEPMQIISGPFHKPKVHFEAPPSHILQKEMSAFIKWFNSFNTDDSLGALTKASIAHLYFESIHPFEDGNGRIGRAIVMKSLSQSFRQPLVISVSDIIKKDKKQYYEALALSNKSLDVTEWIIYFSNQILKAHEYTMRAIKFLISKIVFFQKFEKQLNPRQTKVLLKVFSQGPEGFHGGLSARNYISITKTSRATTTRDLQNLVKIGALKKQGMLKSTRFYLNV